MIMVSPMMQIYLDTKEKYKDCILFYRLGDFYEMFFDDALTASRELELTLTGKDCGMEERAPMCGVPWHAADIYIDKLVKKGYKVAVAEQLEDPKKAKGIVKRDVIRVVTPGTNMSQTALEETKNNYLMSVAAMDKSFGLAITDVSTGEFFVTEVSGTGPLMDEISKYMPSEIVCNDAFLISGVDTEELSGRLQIALSPLTGKYYQEAASEKLLKEHFKVGSLEAIGLKDYPFGAAAAGALLQYLQDTQKNSLEHITELRSYQPGNFMLIDSATRRNLELTETMREKSKRGSLLGVLDKTSTAMGARRLRSFLEQPLLDKAQIIARQDAIEALLASVMDREELREYLAPIYDLERLIGRVAFGTAGPRDLIALKTSLKMLPAVKQALGFFSAPLLKQLNEAIDPLADITSLLEAAIEDDPPLSSKEGGIIKAGYSEEVDRLKAASTEGKNWLLALEQEERERTGIKTLRVKFNRVFGYCIEVTNSFKDMVPEDYIRKQTLVGAERYTTAKLKELESTILGADERSTALQYDLFCEVRRKVADEMLRLKSAAEAVATLDALVSLAMVADRNRYVRPKINEKGVIDIRNGRHPVVEKMLQGEAFIANDTLLDNSENRCNIITGPNMAGKSTYMRQTALIVLMAQIGSFVPADSANIGLVDRIFTRVGAADDLAAGQSTFMVEMTEVANILRNATKRSLIILDEIGRGTSTFDGLAIAWAVVEHVSDPKLLGAKTLFATHYHELTELEGSLQGVRNYCVSVKEQGESIIFLRKIIPGGADKSYGIQVARLAGVPESVLKRARELVDELSDADITERAKEIAESAGRSTKAKTIRRPDDVDRGQMSLFGAVTNDAVVEEIKNLPLETMSPIEALTTLYRLQNDLRNRI
ncbi:MAG: DNA mismatch repair protein MutS [Lachnospiraceae bacterium]|nr:DNA mismatch repair protein MutS [Lachnospiraceae bacterium]